MLFLLRILTYGTDRAFIGTGNSVRAVPAGWKESTPPAGIIENQEQSGNNPVTVLHQ
jgi:hypothetical protein